EGVKARDVFGELNSVGGDAARAFSALGVEGGAAASRVGALAGALGSLKEAAPELIGIVASMTAAVSVFNVIKSSFSDAGALQASMSQLGQAVKDQGGDWAALS